MSAAHYPGIGTLDVAAEMKRIKAKLAAEQAGARQREDADGNDQTESRAA